MRKTSKRKIDDTDIPELTAADFARARPAREVLPKFVAAVAKRGRPRVESPKVMFSFRTDPEILEKLKTDPGLRKKAIAAFERAARK